MKTNLGSYDVAVRFVGGCLIGMWGVQEETWWGFIGLLPVITALAGYCPLYALFHIDTTASDH
jgi:hypothetical protein